MSLQMHSGIEKRRNLLFQFLRKVRLLKEVFIKFSNSAIKINWQNNYFSTCSNRSVKMKTGCWIKFEFFALIRKCTYKLALKGEENCGNEICFGPKTTPKMNNLEWFDINHILESNIEQERHNFEVMTSFFQVKWYLI